MGFTSCQPLQFDLSAKSTVDLRKTGFYLNKTRTVYNSKRGSTLVKRVLLWRSDFSKTETVNRTSPITGRAIVAHFVDVRLEVVAPLLHVVSLIIRLRAS